MIVYGTRATLVKSGFIAEPCPNCGKTYSVQMNVFQRYAHVFWIPFFPIGRTGVSSCGNCKQVLKLKEMPEPLKLAYDNMRQEARVPVWNFSGLGVVALIAVFITIHGKQQAERIAKMVLAPKVNDVFEIKLKDTAYTAMKVRKIMGDTVYFAVNNYQTNEESGLSDLVSKGDQSYDNKALEPFSKSMLVDMNNKDNIIDIDRD